MKRTDLIALAERLPTLIDMLPPGIRATAGVDLCHIADFARQIAQAQPVGTVAQHSYEQYQSVYYGNGNVTPWTLKRPHAAPMLFCELAVGTVLYTLPLED